MTICAHHVPGRLRLKVPAVARSAPRAAAVRARLAALPGVRRIDVNPPADSLIVFYDPTKVATPAIIACVDAAPPAVAGAPDPHDRPRARRRSAAGAGLGARIGMAVFDAMLHKGVEHSLRFLVGAR